MKKRPIAIVLLSPELKNQFITMTGEQKTRIVAISIIIFSALNITFLLLLTGDGGSRGITSRVIRFVATCFFAYFLIQGKFWARYLVGVISLISTITGIVAWIALSRMPAFSPSSIISLWMIILVIFYAWVAWMLLFDKSVSNHFKSYNNL